MGVRDSPILLLGYSGGNTIGTSTVKAFTRSASHGYHSVSLREPTVPPLLRGDGRHAGPRGDDPAGPMSRPGDRLVPAAAQTPPAAGTSAHSWRRHVLGPFRGPVLHRYPTRRPHPNRHAGSDALGRRLPAAGRQAGPGAGDRAAVPEGLRRRRQLRRAGPLVRRPRVRQPRRRPARHRGLRRNPATGVRPW